jgi:enamine deaminase RidA (YjgF/YER057c/UK114 family)
MTVNLIRSDSLYAGVRYAYASMAAAGTALADVLKTTVFVASTQQGDLAAAWQVVEAAFG